MPAPMATGASENSVGNLLQTKVSWMNRTRRIAMSAKYCAMRPGSVSTPAVGALLVQFAGVNVPFAKVGHVPVVAVNSSVYERPLNVTYPPKGGARAER